MLSIDQIARLIGADLLIAENHDNYPAVRTLAEKIHDLCLPDHNMHVAAAILENEVTSTLMDMLAATILATLVDEEGGGRTNIRFSPGSMQEKLADWTWTVEHEGLERNVRITPKNSDAWSDEKPEPKLASLLHTEQLDVSDALPQAEPKTYARPVWAIFYFDQVGNPCLANMLDRADAQRHMADYTFMGRPAPLIENRHCLHTDCPSSRCNVWKDSDEAPGNGMNPDGN